MQQELSFISYASHNHDWFLDNFFLHNTMLLMGLVFAVFLILVFLNRREIGREIKLDRRTVIALLAIFILGFYLRNASYNYGVHVDGYVYAESAKLTLEKGLFVKDCAVGNIASCRLYEQVLFPPGYPFLIAVSYLFTGINSLNASIISAILSSLTIIIVFFVTKQLLKSKETGLYAALIFALFPLDLLFANTGNVRPTSIFFIALALLFYLIALKKDSVRIWTLTAVTTSIAIYIRQENFLLLVPMALGLLLSGYFSKNDYAMLKRKGKVIVFGKKFFIPVILFLLTQLPVQSWILFSNYLGGQQVFSLVGLVITAPRILVDFFQPNQYGLEFNFSLLYNPLVSVLFLASVFLFGKKEFRKALGLSWALFLAYFFTISIYMPRFNSSDYVRYMQPLALPVSMIAGMSLYYLNKEIRVRKEFFLTGIALLLLCTSGIPFQVSLFKDNRAGIPLRESTFFEAVKETPNNCTVISPLYLITTSDAIPDNSRRTINQWLIFSNTLEIAKREISESKCAFLIQEAHYPLSEEARNFIQGLKKEHFKTIRRKGINVEIYRILK